MKLFRLVVSHLILAVSLFFILALPSKAQVANVTISTSVEPISQTGSITINKNQDLTLDIKVSGQDFNKVDSISLEVNNDRNSLLTFYGSNYNFGNCNSSVYGVDENCNSLINKYRNGYGVIAYYTSTESYKEWQIVFKGQGPVLDKLASQTQNLFEVIAKVGNTNVNQTILNLNSTAPVAEQFSAKGEVLGDAAYNFSQTLQVGSRGAEVKELQGLLNAHNMLIAKVGDGSYGNETDYFGNKTKSALMNFQKWYGLTVTGVLDEATRNYINTYLSPLQSGALDLSDLSLISEATGSLTTNLSQPNSALAFTQVLTLGSTGVEVKKLQTFLNAHGYTVATSGEGSLGQESNYYGQKTSAAVKEFQEDNLTELAKYKISEQDLTLGSFDFYTLLLANSILTK